MSIGNHRNVIQTVDFGEAGEKEVTFEVIYYPGEPDRHMSGPMCDAVQGHGSEIDVMGAKIGEHDVFWMFEAGDLALIAGDICSELDDEEPEFDEPDSDDRAAV